MDIEHCMAKFMPALSLHSDAINFWFDLNLSCLFMAINTLLYNNNLSIKNYYHHLINYKSFASFNYYMLLIIRIWLVLNSHFKDRWSTWSNIAYSQTAIFKIDFTIIISIVYLQLVTLHIWLYFLYILNIIILGIFRLLNTAIYFVFWRYWLARNWDISFLAVHFCTTSIKIFFFIFTIIILFS